MELNDRSSRADEVAWVVTRLYWYEDRLYVKRRRGHARTAVAGAPVAPLVEHSVFDERRIVSVEKEERGVWCIKVDAATLRFDAADGSLRQSQ